MSYAPLDESVGGQDPYEVAKSRVTTSVEEFMGKFDKWKEMLESTNTAHNREFSELTDTLKGEYKALSKALKKMDKESVTKLEGKLSKSDLDSRRRFITQMQIAISECRDIITSDHTRETIEKHRRQSADQPLNSETAYERAGRRANDEMLGGHLEMKQKEREKQDEVLDDMLHTIKRLGVHGGLIVAELDEQNELLEEIDTEMDTAQERLNRLANKLDRIMQHSEGKKMCLIFILVVVLVVLIYFMF